MLLPCTLNPVDIRRQGRLLACDFDKTFYRADGSLEGNLAASQRWREAGNLFVLVTGRNLSRLKEVFPQWGKFVDFLITDNGGVVFDRHSMSKLFHCFGLGEIERMLQMVASDALPVYYYMDFFSTKTLPEEVPLKIRLWYRNREKLWEQKRGLEATGVKVLPWPDSDGVAPEVGPGNFAGFLDIVPSDSGKGGMLKALCEALGRNPESVIAVGDDYNDLDMLRQFPSYAMADGRPEAIAAAEGRTVTSVAELIESLL